MSSALMRLNAHLSPQSRGMAACRVGIYKGGSFLPDEAASDCSRQPVARSKSPNIDWRGKFYEPRIPTEGKGLNNSALTVHLLGEHGAEDDTLEAPHRLDATLSFAQERGSLLRGHEEGGQICGVRFRG